MTTGLPKRRLGKTDLELTVLGLGGAPLGELFETVPEVIAEEVLQTAFDAGVRYFDTAPWYGHGLSEHRFGHFLRAQDRDAFVLSTKVGRVYTRPADIGSISTAPWVGGLPFELHFDYGYDGVLRSYEDSLQRLGMNRVDCLLIHDLDEGYHDPESMLIRHRQSLERGGWKALAELRDSGEILAVGAGINDHRMMAYFYGRFDIDFFLVAMPYTLLEQPALHTDFEVCRQRRIGIVVGSPFASGILATGAVANAKYNYAPASAEMLEKTRQIEAVCEEFGVPLQAAALQFPLGHEAVAAVIPGATHPRFVSTNVANLMTPIPLEFWEMLKSRQLIDETAPTPFDSTGTA
jgi:D-threo-aldose 1-dehydrogenase